MALRDIVHLQSAARALGERGGSANTPAQQAHRDRVMGHGRPRLTPITDDQIVDLRGEAAQASDTSMIAICTRALEGSARARRECARVIRAAQAQQ